MEIQMWRICRKVDKFDLKKKNFKNFFFVPYSTHHEGKTFPKNLIVVSKNGENLSHTRVRSNSDFMKKI